MHLVYSFPKQMSEHTQLTGKAARKAKRAALVQTRDTEISAPVKVEEKPKLSKEERKQLQESQVNF